MRYLNSLPVNLIKPSPLFNTICFDVETCSIQNGYLRLVTGPCLDAAPPYCVCVCVGGGSHFSVPALKAMI